MPIRTEVRQSPTQENPTPHGGPSERGIVRLSVNLASDVAAALKDLSSAQGMTITQGVRKAIALWDLIEGERAKGNRIMVVEGEGDSAKYREIILV